MYDLTADDSIKQLSDKYNNKYNNFGGVNSFANWNCCQRFIEALPMYPRIQAEAQKT